ncbi:MAG: ferritin family protein [Candidatus Eiseniibacteriota bacterium]|jgi:rubrerythrin
MDESTKKLVLEAIKTAIITELRGYEIYKAAAERATDPNARLMFEKLARDEQHHKAFLERNFQSILADGTWAVPATAENLNPLDDTEIIDPAFLKRVKGGSFEMAAVAAGSALEQSAIDYYNRAADSCPDPESAQVFRFLATWEDEHLEHLTELEDRLKDEYFAEQGFTPM